jgi:succinyl-diaminopimelate desuccinylase
MKNEDLHKALSLIDGRRNNITKLVSDLIKIRSINPPGDMQEIATFIEELLKNEGFSVNRVEPEQGKISLITSVGKGKPELVFNGHMDVVPSGDPSKWRYDPFSGIIVDGYIYGRGASDMKGGLGALIQAFLVTSKFENKLNGKLTLVLVPDEESGGLLGTKYLIDNNIVVGDAVIIGEPTGLDYIDIGQKGSLWLKLKFKGKSIHGSLAPYLGDNAIIKAYRAITELYNITKLKANPTDDIKHVIDTSTNIADSLIGFKGIGELILKHPTLNVGIIKGGSKINMVPDYCEVDVDIRIPIGLTSKDVVEEIRKILEKYEGEVEVISISEANYTSPHHKLVKTVEETIELVISKKPHVFVQWASSDARYYRIKGIPTIHYGPAEVEGIHGYNERVKTEDVIKASKVYLITALKFLESI